MLVLMGLNVPRNSDGASGFMSHISRWLGPPPCQKRITLTSLAAAAASPAMAWRRSRPLRLIPPSIKEPALRKLRRLIPSQQRYAPLFTSMIIGLGWVD